MPYKMRKVRGKDLYKVWNAETGEIKSHGSTKKNAKAQIKYLNSLHGGSMEADDIQDLLTASYDPELKDVGNYIIDKDLSDDRVKAYVDKDSGKVVSVHRGSKGWRDWLDNYQYLSKGIFKHSSTYDDHKTRQKKINKKYGKDNITLLGHSRAGKYVEQLNDDTKGKKKNYDEVITYNKATNWSDIGRKNKKNQFDIKTSSDPVSVLLGWQKSKNKPTTIKTKTWNPLKAHSPKMLSKLGNKLIGKGYSGGQFKPSKLRVKEMRAFLRDHHKVNGVKKAYGKVPKKELIEELKVIVPLYAGSGNVSFKGSKIQPQAEEHLFSHLDSDLSDIPEHEYDDYDEDRDVDYENINDYLYPFNRQYRGADAPFIFVNKKTGDIKITDEIMEKKLATFGCGAGNCDQWGFQYIQHFNNTEPNKDKIRKLLSKYQLKGGAKRERSHTQNEDDNNQFVYEEVMNLVSQMRNAGERNAMIRQINSLRDRGLWHVIRNIYQFLLRKNVNLHTPPQSPKHQKRDDDEDDSDMEDFFREFQDAYTHGQSLFGNPAVGVGV